MGEPLLRVVNVNAGYEAGNVIHNVNLEAERGEVLALLGPNGSGKTTLLKSICGAVRLNGGNVGINGSELSSMNAVERARNVAYVPQSEDHVFDYTVKELTLMGRLAHSGSLFESKNDLEAADRAMELADCLVFRDRMASKLSGGEAQRVLIARALAQESPLLLCDEPTTHLDPSHQMVIGQLLLRLARGGKAVIVTTHDLNWALEFSDRCVLISDGHIVFDGQLSEAVANNIHESVYGSDFITLQHRGRVFVNPVPPRD